MKFVHIVLTREEWKMLKWLVFEVREVNGHKYSQVGTAFRLETDARKYAETMNSMYEDSELDVTFVVQEAERYVVVSDLWEGLEDGKEN